ncbi:MAG: SH3 domain-containing protein [Spirochaetales bacterium]|nr:SH3 domain-containing protein [Leptospiraceae bacterium]MCP5482503.1 SH3 domain-containing protein [Spirochaetales bacterium]MCP5485793.1 SH3 domain-containing protein [Spirochaetales bacterium]
MGTFLRDQPIEYLLRAVLAALLLVGITDCRQREPIGEAYVIGDRVPILEEPRDDSDVVLVAPQNDRLDILERRIPAADRRNLFYYLVRNSGQEGYVSYEEEAVRKNVISFYTMSGDQGGLVQASGLNLRSEPGITAAVLEVLPKNTVVRVLMQGSIRQTLRGREDTWVKVETDSGAVGFCFAAHLQRGPIEQLREYFSRGMEPIEGYVYITAEDPEFYSDPVERTASSSSDPAPGGQNMLDRLPGQGEYAMVDARQQVEGVTYFHIEEEICDLFECGGGISAWVSQDQATLVNDYLTHSLEGATNSENRAVLAAAQQASNFSARNARVSVISEQAPNVRYYHVATTFGHRDGGELNVIVMREGDSYSALGQYGSAQFADLDQDGNVEVISEYAERGTSTLAVYSLRNRGRVQLLEVATSGGYEIDGDQIVLTVLGELPDGSYGEIPTVYVMRDGQLQRVVRETAE